MIRKLYGRKRAFSLLFLVIIMTSGSVTLLWQLQQKQSTRAAYQTSMDAGNVIGEPTLPAATVDAIFARMGSPMVGTGSVVEQVARQTHIDDAFAMGVWYVETSDGAAGVGRADRNPGSIRGTTGYPSAYDGYTIYPSYTAAIIDWFNVLHNRYVNRGLTSAFSICYPYVGTANSYQWAVKVVKLMYRYRGEAPPVTATPNVRLTATVSAAQAQAQAHQLIHPLRPTISNTAVQGQTQTAQQGSHETQQGEKARRINTAEVSPVRTMPELPIVSIGLVVALAIALASLYMSRVKPLWIVQTMPLVAEVKPVTEALAPFMPLPVMASLDAIVEQQDFPNTGAHASVTRQFAPIPLKSISLNGAASFTLANRVTPLPAVAPNSSNDAGALKHATPTETTARRGIRPPLRLRPLQEEEGERGYQQEREERVLVAAVPTRRGLLQRYGEHQQL